jgi:hypothetical protein
MQVWLVLASMVSSMSLPGRPSVRSKSYIMYRYRNLVVYRELICREQRRLIRTGWFFLLNFQSVTIVLSSLRHEPSRIAETMGRRLLIHLPTRPF